MSDEFKLHFSCVWRTLDHGLTLECLFYVQTASAFGTYARVLVWKGIQLSAQAAEDCRGPRLRPGWPAHASSLSRTPPAWDSSAAARRLRGWCAAAAAVPQVAAACVGRAAYGTAAEGFATARPEHAAEARWIPANAGQHVCACARYDDNQGGHG
jgi:hypothetical protein